MKIRPVGAKLFHADGQTDRTRIILAFRNFVTGPKNVPVLKLAAPILALFFTDFRFYTCKGHAAFSGRMFAQISTNIG